MFADKKRKSYTLTKIFCLQVKILMFCQNFYEFIKTINSCYNIFTTSKIFKM